jgi:hypothetical protein
MDVRRGVTGVMLVLSLLLAAACSSSPSSSGAAGSSQLLVEPRGDGYFLRMQGTAGESVGALERRVLQEAAKVAQRDGHSRFAVLDRKVEQWSSRPVVPHPMSQIPITRTQKDRQRRYMRAQAEADADQSPVYRVGILIGQFDGPTPYGVQEHYDVADLL